MQRINRRVILAILLTVVLSILFVVSIFYAYRLLFIALLPITTGLFITFLYYTHKEKCDDESIRNVMEVSKTIYMAIISVMFAITIYQLVKHQLDSLIGLTLISMILAKAFSFMKHPQVN